MQELILIIAVGSTVGTFSGIALVIGLGLLIDRIQWVQIRKKMRLK